MSDRINVLDHGYVQLIEGWGSDERIIEAARMSTGKGFLGWGPREERCTDCGGFGCTPANEGGGACARCGGVGHRIIPGDERLLAYLWNNKHSTPFEMAGLTIEVSAPIFVFRQWHRHRTQSYNEMSARYTPLPDENYLPTVERIEDIDVSGNKQAGKVGTRTPTHDEAIAWLEDLAAVYDQAERVYQRGLTIGVNKELARLPVPVGRYTRMRASANLRNWLAFETLRMHPHAQEEIRVYADALGVFIKRLFPRTWELFIEGVH